ncbi:hypothetical protein PUN28_015756 [Cardiocondyla obscurior]|uniref:Uncharacterized protein n=1 Tax=Cardiocondyla obscurior TaxID=286306 RepID=A0AAW2EVP9_9HYME
MATQEEISTGIPVTNKFQEDVLQSSSQSQNGERNWRKVPEGVSAGRKFPAGKKFQSKTTGLQPKSALNKTKTTEASKTGKPTYASVTRDAPKRNTPVFRKAASEKLVDEPLWTVGPYTATHPTRSIYAQNMDLL